MGGWSLINGETSTGFSPNNPWYFWLPGWDMFSGIFYRTHQGSRRDLKKPSSELTIRPWQIGLGRLVSTKNCSFSGSMFVCHRVIHIWIYLIYSYLSQTGVVRICGHETKGTWWKHIKKCWRSNFGDSPQWLFQVSRGWFFTAHLGGAIPKEMWSRLDHVAWKVNHLSGGWLNHNLDMFVDGERHSR
jgi:hypothetical protein